MNNKKLILFLFFVGCFPIIMLSQSKETGIERKNYLSVNPINMIFFQQIGITYEHKFDKIGIGISPGYIYANNKEYSNWFIAGPVSYGSLGYYSGYYIIPHLNIYILKSKITNNNIQSFLSLKIVYKNLKIDSTQVTVWENYGNGYASYRKMDDNVNIYGGFVDFGFRYLKRRLFIESNFGVGFLWTRHDMVIFGKGAPYPNDIEDVNPPSHSTKTEFTPTINFTINIGITF